MNCINVPVDDNHIVSNITETESILESVYGKPPPALEAHRETTCSYEQ